MKQSARAVLVTRIRALLSPEASWRRPDPQFKSAVARLSFLFTVPLYESSSADRALIGEFYASIPRTAQFIVFRTAEEVQLLLRQASRSQHDAASLVHRVLCRLFTEATTQHLLDAAELEAKSRPDEAPDLRRIAHILALTSVENVQHVKQLSDFEVLLEKGRELAKFDEFINGQSDLVRAWIAKHWEYCGANVYSAFESWYVSGRLIYEIGRVLRDNFGTLSGTEGIGSVPSTARSPSQAKPSRD